MLWICTECTTAYSVGAQHCPQCGSEDYLEEGAENGMVFVGETGPEPIGELAKLAESGVIEDAGA